MRRVEREEDTADRYWSLGVSYLQEAPERNTAPVVAPVPPPLSAEALFRPKSREETGSVQPGEGGVCRWGGEERGEHRGGKRHRLQNRRENGG